jgi:hypothetical protein
MWLQIGMDSKLKLLREFINQIGLAVQSWLLILYNSFYFFLFCILENFVIVLLLGYR